MSVEKFKIQTTQFEQAYKKASVRWQNYPLHIANIQSFNLKKSDISLPTLRFVRSLGMKLPTRHLSLVDIIRERCGLDENDKPAKYVPERLISPTNNRRILRFSNSPLRASVAFIRSHMHSNI